MEGTHIPQTTSRATRPLTFSDRPTNINTPIANRRERQKIYVKPFSSSSESDAIVRVTLAHRRSSDPLVPGNEHSQVPGPSASDDRNRTNTLSHRTRTLTGTSQIASHLTEESPAPKSNNIPPPPDFSSAPYAKHEGPVFAEEVYEELFEKLDDRIVDLYVVCIRIAGILTLDQKSLDSTGYWLNVLDLGRDDVEEIRLSCYRIAYKLLTENWQWDALCKEQFLVDAIKNNLRRAQKMQRIDSCSEIMLGLGFTDEFLYE
jgi:hypothetical protein